MLAYAVIDNYHESTSPILGIYKDEATANIVVEALVVADEIAGRSYDYDVKEIEVENRLLKNLEG